MGCVRRQVAVQTRDDDVIESAQLIAQVRCLADIQGQVGHPHAVCRFRAPCDQGLRDIHPDRLRIRICQGKRQQTFPGAAADSQHARPVKPGGFDPI
ncbi:hypothetical protein D3C85_1582470 [compost metagenome]